MRTPPTASTRLYSDLGEVVAKIAAKSFWIWRAVDQNATVLVEILQPRWNKKTAKRPRCRLMKRHDLATKRSVTDKLRSYGQPSARSLPTSASQRP
ncbi:MAG: DDE-type integrase/transposase/recombinase [Roseobacter sp.]